jgi:hypothetical protein
MSCACDALVDLISCLKFNLLNTERVLRPFYFHRSSPLLSSGCNKMLLPLNNILLVLGACGSVVGSCTMLRDGRSPVPVPD